MTAPFDGDSARKPAFIADAAMVLSFFVIVLTVTSIGGVDQVGDQLSELMTRGLPIEAASRSSSEFPSAWFNANLWPTSRKDPGSSVTAAS